MDEGGRAPSARFVAGYRVRFDEAGADGTARASTLLRFAQDVAWQHGTSLGLDRAWYEQRGLAWLVRAIDLELRQPIPVGAMLEVSTEVIGQHRRIWARRLVEVRLAPARPASSRLEVGRPEAAGSASGIRPAPLAAVARTDWVLVDASGRLVRIGDPFSELFAVPPATFELSRVPLLAAPPSAVSSTVTVRPQELDPNGHVNNAVHLDWLDEAVDGAGGADAVGASARRYQLEYLAPLERGSPMLFTTWRDQGGWAVRMARGPDGAEAARARLTPVRRE